MWVRTAVAFGIAPAIGALAASIVGATVLSFRFGATMSAAWTIFALLMWGTFVTAYAVALVVAVSWFLVFPWSLRSTWEYAFAGATIAAIAASLLILKFDLEPIFFSMLGILAGTITGLVFGWIAMPTSNDRWSGRHA